MPEYKLGGVSRICTEEVFERELKTFGYKLVVPKKPKVQEKIEVPETYVVEETIEMSDVKAPQRRNKKK